MSEYQKIIESGKSNRGRKPLPPEEKARRQELQKIENRKRAEARRRAALVLQHRHSDEFQKLYKEEFKAITSSK